MSQAIITKCDSFFYYKTMQIFIKKRDKCFITKCYKTRQVLQNEPIITKHGTIQVYDTC